MRRTDLLDAIDRGLANGEISVNDLLERASRLQTNRKSAFADWVSRALYYLGGGVILLGIVVFTAERWDILSSGQRIVVTLGAGVLALSSGIALSRRDKWGAAGPALILVSVLMMPVGLLIAWDEWNWNPGRLVSQVQISLLLALTYAGPLVKLRKSVLGLATMIFSTWFFFALTNWLARDLGWVSAELFNTYRVMIVSSTVAAIGYTLVENRSWHGHPMLNLGMAGIAVCGFVLFAWSTPHALLWKILFPVMIYAMVHLSAHCRSRSILWSAATALGAYLTYFTVEYFSDSLGWALSLVVIGVILMGIAYLTLRYSRTLLKTDP